jgi:hypothetical protein
MDADSDRCAAELSDARVDVLGYACLVGIMSMGKGYHCQSEARLQQVTARERAPVRWCTGQPRRLGSPTHYHRRGRPTGDHGRRDLRLLGQPFWHRRASQPRRLGHQPASLAPALPKWWRSADPTGCGGRAATT